MGQIKFWDLLGCVDLSAMPAKLESNHVKASDKSKLRNML